jgi:hypothetical protein
LWQEVFIETEVHEKFKAFMRSVRHSFNTASPLKLMHKRRPLRHGWITKGIKISSRKMSFLNVLNKQPKITEEVLTYIVKHRIIYR